MIRSTTKLVLVWLGMRGLLPLRLVDRIIAALRLQHV